MEHWQICNVEFAQMSILLQQNIVIFLRKEKLQIALHVKKELEIGQIAAHDQNKADCLIIMGTSLRIPGVKFLIKDFAKAVHKRKGYVILVNDTNVVTKEWNGIIDYQIE
ncbi:25855_t:CDS:2, partial [Gigaspora margarita]